MTCQDQTKRRDDEMTVLARQVDELVRGQVRHDVRFDRLEAKVDGLEAKVDGLGAVVAVLKTDVAVLKTDMIETKERLGRLELATERRFDRVDAKLEQLITFIVRDETEPT